MPIQLPCQFLFPVRNLDRCAHLIVRLFVLFSRLFQLDWVDLDSVQSWRIGGIEVENIAIFYLFSFGLLLENPAHLNLPYQLCWHTTLTTTPRQNLHQRYKMCLVAHTETVAIWEKNELNVQIILASPFHKPVIAVFSSAPYLQDCWLPLYHQSLADHSPKITWEPQPAQPTA